MKNRCKLDARKSDVKNMKSAPKWNPHWGKNLENVYRKRGPKIDAKKGANARTRLAGRRCVAATLLRLIISSRLVFRLVFRLVLAPFHVSGRLVTFRGVLFLVWHSFSLPFVRPPTRLDV